MNATTATFADKYSLCSITSLVMDDSEENFVDLIAKIAVSDGNNTVSFDFGVAGADVAEVAEEYREEMARLDALIQALATFRREMTTLAASTLFPVDLA